MQIRLGPGIEGASRNQSTHYLYDIRTGAILETHHFVGALPESDIKRKEELRRGAHKASGVPLEHLGVLTTVSVPPGDGALTVDHAAQSLARGEPVGQRRLKP